MVWTLSVLEITAKVYGNAHDIRFRILNGIELQTEHSISSDEI